MGCCWPSLALLDAARQPREIGQRYLEFPSRRRVLHADGALVLGMVFAETAWGQWYAGKGRAGHPFYSAARFLTRGEVKAILKRSGLAVVAARSTLLQPPSDAPRPETAGDGDQPEAGFAGWKAVSCRAASDRPRPI